MNNFINTNNNKLCSLIDNNIILDVIYIHVIGIFSSKYKTFSEDNVL